MKNMPYTWRDWTALTALLLVLIVCLPIFGYPPDEDEAVPEPPPHFTKPLDELFPWSEPIVFCSGRYAVHRVSEPIHKFWR